MTTLTPQEFEDQLRSGAKNLRTILAVKLLSHATEIVGNAKANFTGDDLPRSKTGRRMYSRYDKTTKKSIAIRTGNSGYMVGPRNITTNLQSSIEGSIVKQGSEISAVVTAGKSTPIVYAAALEFGYPARNLEPRLYIGRAFEEQKQLIEPDLSDLLRLALFRDA